MKRPEETAEPPSGPVPSLTPLFVVILGYLGGVIAFTSAYTGTCTQNVADQLNLVILSIPFYLAAGFGFYRIKLIWVATLASLTLAPLIIWQGAFAVWLAAQLFAGVSACDVLFGGAYGLDGNEVRYAALWLIAGLGLPGLLALRMFRPK